MCDFPTVENLRQHTERNWIFPGKIDSAQLQSVRLGKRGAVRCQPGKANLRSGTFDTMTLASSLDWLNHSLTQLKQDDLYRPRRLTRHLPNGRAVFGETKLVDFTANDYLGLAGHPAVLAAGREVLEATGSQNVGERMPYETFGSTASALVSGRSPASAALEETLARFEGTEDAILFPTGYAANLGTLTALIGPQDIVFCDRFNHACLVDGCRLSRAAFRVYRADRLDNLKRHLAHATEYTRRWIITEGLFGMDGTIAPLQALCDLGEKYGAELIVDEAHGTGVLGEHGRGACEHSGVEDRVAVRTGTLSKGVGALGGFVPGSTTLIEYLWNKARTQMFSTALPPVVCAAADAAIRQIETDPTPRRTLTEQARRFRERLTATFAGGDVQILGEPDVPIVPIVLGDSARTLRWAEQLRQRGFAVAAIRPPTVPRGTARLRVSLSAAHAPADIDALVEAFGEVAGQ